jgi:cysteine desulfuration protein SufE
MRAADNALKLREGLSCAGHGTERLEQVMLWAEGLDPYPEEERGEERMVRGCVSRVWLCLRLEDGVCRFFVDADSPMVKGLAGLVVRLYHHASPEEVASLELKIVDYLNLNRLLSPTRLRSLDRIQAAARRLAAALATARAKRPAGVDRLS